MAAATTAEPACGSFADPSVVVHLSFT